MAGMHVVDGIGELTKALAELTPKLEKKVLRQAMRKAAKPILAQAKANAPVGQITVDTQRLVFRALQFGKLIGATAKQSSKARARIIKHEETQLKKSGSRYPGQLRDSLKVRAMKSKKGRIGVVVQTREGDYKGDTFYGAFVEYGTSKMAAQPYMRPAFDTKAGEAERIIADELKAGIDKLAAEAKK